MPNGCKVCLDIDGVMVDFVGGAAKVVGYDPSVFNAWNCYSLIGVTEDEFWDAIDEAGSEFWRGLTPYPWYKQLHSICEDVGSTIFLTTNSRHHKSAEGKVLWMQDHFGFKFRNYLMGPKKEFCATPSTVLVDDSDENCRKFTDHGGHAILFPRPWNENRGISDPVSYTADKLFELKRLITKGAA